MASFERTRLEVARRRRGMNQRDVADVCEVTSQYISSIERGEEFPAEQFVERLASVLNYPVSFFYAKPLDPVPSDALSFRAQRKMSSKTRDTGWGIGHIAADIITPDLMERFRLPSADIPDLSEYSQEPEKAADLLRSFWVLGYEPIQNMVHLLESKGIRVFWLHHDSVSLDAFSFWHNGLPFTILNTLKDAGERGRFDAAHELGHLVLHQRAKDLDSKEAESQANLFASAFLMPAETFRQECPDRPDLGILYRLKPRWKVSVAAMIMRGVEVGIFSDWQKRHTFKQLNAVGMRTREKLRIQREESKLHPMIFEALRKKQITPSEYAQLLSLNFEDIKEIMPVATHYIEVESPETSLSVTKEYGHLRVIMGGKGR